MSDTAVLIEWYVSSSSARAALDILDGCGMHAEHGPHYSRRTVGSRTFTGVGPEVVLVTGCNRALWSVVLSRHPGTDPDRPWVWRNNVFRNLGAGLSSDLIRSALARTYEEWARRYDALPDLRLRTEIDTRRVRSLNPGYCYRMAGWEPGEIRNGIRFFYAPEARYR